MYTAPQRMLLEMDARSRELWRRAQNDPSAEAQYYLSVARSGREDLIRNLAILGDPAAQQVIKLSTNPEHWSTTTKLEKDVTEHESRDLAIMIADELLKEYEDMLHNLGSEGINPQAIELIQDYINRYYRGQRIKADEDYFSQLEDELRDDASQGGRLYHEIMMTGEEQKLRSIIGGVGLACLIRTTPFEARRTDYDYRPGLGPYLGNALLRAQKEGIPTTMILGRIRDRLRSQLFG